MSNERDHRASLPYKNYAVRVEEGMGGDVEEWLKEHEGNEFQCACGATITARPVLGDEDGIEFEDENGVKWQLYVQCPECGYNMHVNKMESRWV